MAEGGLSEWFGSGCSMYLLDEYISPGQTEGSADALQLILLVPCFQGTVAQNCTSHKVVYFTSAETVCSLCGYGTICCA